MSNNIGIMDIGKRFATGCYIWQEHTTKCGRCSSITKSWHVHGVKDASRCSRCSKIPKSDPLYEKIHLDNFQNADVRKSKVTSKRKKNKKKNIFRLDSRWITEPPKIPDILKIKLTSIQIVGKCGICSATTKSWHVHDVNDASRCSTCLKIPKTDPLYQKIYSDKPKKTGVRSFMKNSKGKKDKRKKLPYLDSRWINDPPKIPDILQIKLTRIQIVRQNRQRKSFDRSATMERRNNLLLNPAAKSNNVVDKFSKTKKNCRKYSKKHEKYLKF